ncbi:EamA family transporter [bacterium]|nr:EamA family transporter [bacterium]
MQFSQKFKANFALVLVCFFWGTTYLAIAEGVEALPPSVLLALRFAIAGGVLLVVSLAMGIPLPRDRGEWGRIAMVGITHLAVGSYMLAWAEQRVESGLASVIIAAFPFFFVGMAALGGEKMNKRIWLGILVGFLGIGVLFWPDLVGIRAPQGTLYYVSIGALMVTNISWAYGSWFAQRHPVRTHKLMSVALQSLICGALLVPVGAVTGELSDVQLSLKGWLAVGYLAIFGSVLAYGCYMYILDHMSAAKVSLHAYINPLVAVILGAMLRGEDFGPWRIAGTAVILASVFFVNTETLHEPGHEEQPVPSPGEKGDVGEVI